MIPPSVISQPIHTDTVPIIGVRRLPGISGALIHGEVMRLNVGSKPKQECFLYVPRRLKQPGRLFVTVHGISRNAREHAERFAPFAEKYGVVLAAPRFGRKRFSAYQRLSLNQAGHKSDVAFDEVISEICALLDWSQVMLYLFGYSGGGQFVHRYAMAHPARIAKAVIGAAGWYTFPDSALRYPRGLRPSRKQGIKLAFPEFLRIPMAVVVGDGDTDRDAALNQSPRLDRQQGRTRLERGQRWIEAMQAAARRQGLDTHFHFQSLPDVGHDFADAMIRSDMGDAVFMFLFG